MWQHGSRPTRPVADIQDNLGKLKQSLVDLVVVLDIGLVPYLRDHEIRSSTAR